MNIYIAGPYTPRGKSAHVAIREAARNVSRAIEAAIAVLKKGHVPFVPHLSHYIHTHPKCDREFNWYAVDDTFLTSWADAILVIGESPGVSHELELAEFFGLKVFRSLDEIPEDESGKKRLLRSPEVM